MEDFAVLLREAEQKIKIADHLLSTTYPAVKEPKLLFSVIENIFRALDLTIVAVLTYEKHFKSLPEFGQTFEGCIEVFRKYDGIGLGLSLAYRFAKLNHIELYVKSEKSAGTRITLLYPKDSLQSVQTTVSAGSHIL